MPRPFTIDDMFAFDFVTEAQLSPTGRYVVYTLMRSHHAHACEYTNLMLIDMHTGIHTALTTGDWTDSTPVWSVDESHVIFLSNRNGNYQLYTVTRTDATVTQLTNMPQGCAGPLVLSPDSRTLAFSATQRVEPFDLQKPHRWTRHIPRFEGIGNVDAFVKHIYTIDLMTHAVTQLTTGSWNHTPCDWSPDGARLLYTASLNPESILTSADLYVTDRHGNIQRILDSTWGTIQQARWLDDAQIVIAGIPSQRIYGSKNDIFVMHIASTHLTCRTASLPNHLEARMHDDSTVPWVELPIPLIIDITTQSVITCYQDRGRIHVIQIALTGPEQITTLVGGNRFCMPFGFVHNQLIFGVATPTDPSQIVVFDRVSGSEKPLTHINQAIRAELLWPEIRPIHTTGSDGSPV
ncbi:MAG: TolB family protein, partial [Roseiflexaceae bacterium]